MAILNHIASTTEDHVGASPRTMGSIILSYCIALPLFGRAVFPMLRDKANITLASSFTDPQIVATYLLAAVVTFRICTASGLFQHLSRGRAVRMLLVFVAACIASAFGSRFVLFSLWRCFEVTLLSLWAIAMIQDAAGTSDPAKAVRAFYGISVAILAGVFIGLIINPSGAWAVEGDIERLTGNTGYSLNPNDIGTIAAMITVGCYVRAVERGSLKYILASALFLVVCYVSHSRASYIALTIGFLAATVVLGRIAHRRAIIFVMGSCTGLAMTALALVSHAVRDFFVVLMTRGHEAQNLESFGGRLELWEFGLKIFRERPYLGTGYGTYPEGLEGGHFHNVFIELLVTTGIVGTLCYLAFLFVLAAAVKQSVGRTNLKNAVERITAADLVTIPVVIIVANGATAGAAYYSWDLLGLVSVAVTSAVLLVRRRGPESTSPAIKQMPFSNLLR
jgi:O-antigen ligase